MRKRPMNHKRWFPVEGTCATSLALLLLAGRGDAQPQIPDDPIPIPICSTPTLGCWKTLPNPQVTCVNVIALKTGKILVENRGTGTNIFQQYQIFDPITDTFGALQSATVQHNMYCAGFDQLNDGRVLHAGGLSSPDTQRATIYNPDNNTWAAQSNMSAYRFYPTVSTLSSREILALDGTGTGATTPEIFEFNAVPQWRKLLRAAYGAPPNDFDLGIYPYSFVISPGKVIYVGSRFISSDFTRILDPVFETWTQPFPAADAIPGKSSIMYDRDQIMKAGPTQTWTLAAATPGAVWQQKASLNILRSLFFLTALANGNVFASGSVTTPELYNVDNDTWTQMKPAAVARGDHSGTVLMCDARVFTAGPTLTAEVYSPPYLFNPNGTLATRPVIDSVTSSMGTGIIKYDETFKLVSSQAGIVDEIRLIRLGAATHSWDMGQRSVQLEFRQACCDPNLEPGVGGNPICIEGHTCCLDGTWTCNEANGTPSCTTVCDKLNVWAPQHPYQISPGYSQLFILVNGVPSNCSMVRLLQCRLGPFVVPVEEEAIE